MGDIKKTVKKEVPASAVEKENRTAAIRKTTVAAAIPPAQPRRTGRSAVIQELRAIPIKMDNDAAVLSRIDKKRPLLSWLEWRDQSSGNRYRLSAEIRP
ncbi:hypothetical protein LSTR_LSTR011702 [Laodelphax striatellus]|uniref:Uncharacterized protein n=1 Tax=Laodelphax striatellus TaxID=195883 RepID=A0A482WUZ7_LAOST|nr:hypothetical protein LSTR_LSTR011702 [Laodelphax striatellus]